MSGYTTRNGKHVRPYERPRVRLLPEAATRDAAVRQMREGWDRIAQGTHVPICDPLGTDVYLDDAEIQHILKGKRYTVQHRERFAEIFALAVQDPDHIALQSNGRRRYYRQLRGADWWRYAVLVDDLPHGSDRVVTAFRIVRVAALSNQFDVAQMLYERPQKYTPPFLRSAVAALCSRPPLGLTQRRRHSADEMVKAPRVVLQAPCLFPDGRSRGRG